MVTFKEIGHRELLSYSDLPEEVRSDFDYLSEDEHPTPRFANVGTDKDPSWVDCNDTEGILGHRLDSWNFAEVPEQWRGAVYLTDSFFSMTLILWHEECPQEEDGHEYTSDGWDCVSVAVVTS